MTKSQKRGANSRGVRNRNPGNIRWSDANPWVGKLPRDLAIEAEFERFDIAENGIRAMVIVIMSYHRRGLRTLEQIVDAWAPPNENPTQIYTQRLVEETGIGRNDEIDPNDWATVRAIVVAKIKVECAGYEYPAAVIDEGLRRAGLLPTLRRRDLARQEAASPRGLALTAVAGAGLAESAAPGAIATVVEQAKPIVVGVQSLAPSVPVGQAIAIAAALLLAFFIVRRTGLLDRVRGWVGL